jgi:uncharacterized protein YbjT (DUF2867 family)
MTDQAKKTSVLVVGATGFLGMEICRQLIQAGKSVKAFVRTSSDPAKIKTLQEMGAETREGDLKNINSIIKAVAGVDAIISTASSTLSRQEGDSIESVDNDGQLKLIQVASDKHVNQFVFISFSPMKGEFPLQISKRNVERTLMESKMNYTILQPTFFMEIWLSPALGFDYQNSKTTIYGEGKNKLSWISLVDVAAIAVASLDSETARNSIFPLGGPEMLSPLEVVRIFEKHTGNKFTVDHVPVEALQAQKNAAADPMSESFACLMLAYTDGDNIDMSETRKVYPFRLTSVSDFVQRIPIVHEI